MGKTMLIHERATCLSAAALLLTSAVSAHTVPRSGSLELEAVPRDHWNTARLAVALAGRYRIEWRPQPRPISEGPRMSLTAAQQVDPANGRSSGLGFRDD
jgi:hypothetical protein